MTFNVYYLKGYYWHAYVWMWGQTREGVGATKEIALAELLFKLKKLKHHGQGMVEAVSVDL